MPKLDRSLAIGRANYQRWLGTEPEEIAAAAEVLRRFEPEHPCLLELEVRLCRARQIKAMLTEILHPERMEEHECLAIRVARKLKAIDVIDVLSDLFILRGVPGHIRSDNGPEFIAKAVQEWISAVGAKT